MASSLRTLLVALCLLPCPLAGQDNSGGSSQQQQPPPKEEKKPDSGGTGSTTQPPPEQKQPARMPTDITASVLRRAGSDKQKETGVDVKLEGLGKVNVRIHGDPKDIKKSTQVRVVVRSPEGTPEKEAASLDKLKSDLGKDAAVILTVDAAKAKAVDYDGWGSSGLAALQQAIEAVADATGKDEFRLSATGPVADYLARNYENDNVRSWEAWQRTAEVTDFVNQFVNDLVIANPKGLTPDKMESFEQNNVSVSFRREGGDIHRLDAKNVKGIIDSMPRELSERERPKVPDMKEILAQAPRQAEIPATAPKAQAYQPVRDKGERINDALREANKAPRAAPPKDLKPWSKPPPAPKTTDGIPDSLMAPRKLPAQPPAAPPKAMQESLAAIKGKASQTQDGQWRRLETATGVSEFTSEAALQSYLDGMAAIKGGKPPAADATLPQNVKDALTQTEGVSVLRAGTDIKSGKELFAVFSDNGDKVEFTPEPFKAVSALAKPPATAPTQPDELKLAKDLMQKDPQQGLRMLDDLIARLDRESYEAGRAGKDTAEIDAKLKEALLASGLHRLGLGTFSDWDRGASQLEKALLLDRHALDSVSAASLNKETKQALDLFKLAREGQARTPAEMSRMMARLAEMGLTDPKTAAAILEKIRSGAVFEFSKGGTGFFFGRDGKNFYALTNQHVLDAQVEFTRTPQGLRESKVPPSIRLGGKNVPVEVVAQQGERYKGRDDMAIVKVPASYFQKAGLPLPQTLELGGLQSPQGFVVSIGHPHTGLGGGVPASMIAGPSYADPKEPLLSTGWSNEDKANGRSGSPKIDLKSGKVVGLLFHGSQSNITSFTGIRAERVQEFVSAHVPGLLGESADKGALPPAPAPAPAPAAPPVSPALQKARADVERIDKELYDEKLLDNAMEKSKQLEKVLGKSASPDPLTKDSLRDALAKLMVKNGGDFEAALKGLFDARFPGRHDNPEAVKIMAGGLGADNGAMQRLLKTEPSLILGSNATPERVASLLKAYSPPPEPGSWQYAAGDDPKLQRAAETASKLDQTQYGSEFKSRLGSIMAKMDVATGKPRAGMIGSHERAAMQDILKSMSENGGDMQKALESFVAEKYGKDGLSWLQREDPGLLSGKGPLPEPARQPVQERFQKQFESIDKQLKGRLSESISRRLGISGVSKEEAKERLLESLQKNGGDLEAAIQAVTGQKSHEIGLGFSLSENIHPSEAMGFKDKAAMDAKTAELKRVAEDPKANAVDRYQAQKQLSKYEDALKFHETLTRLAETLRPAPAPAAPPAPAPAPAAPKIDRDAQYSIDLKPGQKLTQEQAEQLIGSAMERVNRGQRSVIRGSPVETGADGVNRLRIQTPQGTASFAQKNGEWTYEGRGMKLTHEGFGAWSTQDPTPPADLQKVVEKVDPTGKTRVQMGDKGEWNELADSKGVLKFKDQAALETHLAAMAGHKAGKTQLPDSLPQNVKDAATLANSRLPAGQKISVMPAGSDPISGEPLYMVASGDKTELTSEPFKTVSSMIPPAPAAPPPAPPAQKPVPAAPAAQERFSQQLKSIDAKVGISKLVADRLGVSEQEAQTRLEAGLQKHGGDLDKALQEVAGKKFSEIGLDYAQQAKVDPAERLGFKDRAALDSEMNRLRDSSKPEDKKTLAAYEQLLKAHQTVAELAAPKPAPPAQQAPAPAPKPAVPLPAAVKEFLKGQNMSDEAVLKALQGEGLKVPASVLFGDKTRSDSAYLKAVGDVNGRLAKVVVSFHGDRRANVAGTWGREAAEAAAKDIPKGSYSLIISPQGDWQNTSGTPVAGMAYLDGAAKVSSALGNPQAERVLIAHSGGGTQITAATDALAMGKKYGELISKAQSQQDLDAVVAQAKAARLIGKSEGLQELKDFVAKAETHAKLIERIVDSEAVASYSGKQQRENFISVLKDNPHIKADFYRGPGSRYDYQRQFQSGVSQRFGGQGFDNGGSEGKDTDRLRFRASDSHGQAIKDGLGRMFENLNFDGSGPRAGASALPAPTVPMPSVVPPAPQSGVPDLRPEHIGPASDIGHDGSRLENGVKYHKLDMQGLMGMYKREFFSAGGGASGEPVRIVVTHAPGMSGGSEAYSGGHDPKRDQSPLLNKAHQALAEQKSKELGKPVVVEARYLVAKRAEGQSYPDNWHGYKNDESGYKGVEVPLHTMLSTREPLKISYFSGSYSLATSHNNAVSNGLEGKLDSPQKLMGNRAMLADLAKTHSDAQTRQAAQAVLDRLNALEKAGGSLPKNDAQLGEAVKGLMQRYAQLYLNGGTEYRADAMYNGLDAPADAKLMQKMKDMGVRMTFTYGLNPDHGSPRPMDRFSDISKSTKDLPQKLQAAEKRVQGLRDQITKLENQGGSPEQIAKLRAQVREILQRDGITELQPFGDGKGQGRLQISRQLGSVTVNAFLVKGHNDAFHGRASKGDGAGDALLQAFKGAGVNQSLPSQRVGDGTGEPKWLTELLAGIFDNSKPRDSLAALPSAPAPVPAGPVAPKPAPQAPVPVAPKPQPKLSPEVQKLIDDFKAAYDKMPKNGLLTKTVREAREAFIKSLPPGTWEKINKASFIQALDQLQALEAKGIVAKQEVVAAYVQIPNKQGLKMMDLVIWDKNTGQELVRVETSGSLPFVNDAPGKSDKVGKLFVSAIETSPDPGWVNQRPVDWAIRNNKWGEKVTGPYDLHGNFSKLDESGEHVVGGKITSKGCPNTEQVIFPEVSKLVEGLISKSPIVDKATGKVLGHNMVHYYGPYQHDLQRVETDAARFDAMFDGSGKRPDPSGVPPVGPSGPVAAPPAGPAPQPPQPKPAPQPTGPLTLAELTNTHQMTQSAAKDLLQQAQKAGVDARAVLALQQREPSLSARAAAGILQQSAKHGQDPDKVTAWTKAVAETLKGRGMSVPSNLPEMVSLVLKISAEEGVKAEQIFALAGTESDFRHNLTSDAGAEGLLQLMPGAGRSVGVRDSDSLEGNIRAGIRYWKQGLELAGGDLKGAAAYYNGGPGGLKYYQDTGRLYSETKNSFLPRFDSYSKAFEGSMAAAAAALADAVVPDSAKKVLETAAETIASVIPGAARTVPAPAPVPAPVVVPPAAPVSVTPLRQPVSKPEMLSRKDWGATQADTDSMTEQNPKQITVHHTGEMQKPKTPIEQKMRGLQRFSKDEKGWGDVPYHYYIGADGKIAEGRSVEYAGDTNTKYDTSGHVQVVLEGNFTKEKPTAAQLKSLGQLTSWLADTHRIPASEIKGHGDYAKTECPGKALMEHIPALRSEVGGALDGTAERRVLPELFDGSLRPEGPVRQQGTPVIPDSSRVQTVGKAEVQSLTIGGREYAETRQTYKVDGVKLNVISIIPKEGYTRLDSVNMWVHGRSSSDLRPDTSGAREDIVEALKAGEGAMFVYPKSAGEAWPEFVKSYMGDKGQEDGDKAKALVDAFYHLTKDAPNKDAMFTMNVLSAGGIVGGATMRYLTSQYGKDPTVTHFVNNHFRAFTDGDSAAEKRQVELYAQAAKLFDGLKLPVSMSFVHSRYGAETDFGNFSAHPLHKDLVAALEKQGGAVVGGSKDKNGDILRDREGNALPKRGTSAVVRLPNGTEIAFTSDGGHYESWKGSLVSSVQTASVTVAQHFKSSLPGVATATAMTEDLTKRVKLDPLFSTLW